MGEATVMELLGQFGFPVFVAVWFMWRMEKRMDRMAELISASLQAQAVLAKSLDTDVEDPRLRARTEGPS